ncbi:MAG: IPT/TIG domain-containing protein [Bacteroidetes bacterium]|nr:IPT/TIG domain-containing protein [Bacteroidota bacterium]
MHKLMIISSLIIVALIIFLLGSCAKTFDSSYNEVALKIDSIVPSNGSAGTPVRIYGTGFALNTTANKIYFNGTLATIDNINANTIGVLLSYAPVNGKTGNVKVTTNGLTTTGPVFTYTVPVPVITDVEYNGLFSIVGNNFDPTASIVRIGGQVVSGFTYSDYGNGQASLTKSSYTPPANLDNPAQVTVTVSSATSSPYPYLFYPQINSVTPDTVSFRNVVTLNGILFGSRSLPSSLKAYYLDGNNRKVYMSPDPTINSWNTNTITITMPDYGSYFSVGNGAQPFYFEVNVGGKTASATAYFHIL